MCVFALYRAVALVFDYLSGSSISEIVVEKMFCSGKLCSGEETQGGRVVEDVVKF